MHPGPKSFMGRHMAQLPAPAMLRLAEAFSPAPRLLSLDAPAASGALSESA